MDLLKRDYLAAFQGGFVSVTEPVPEIGLTLSNFDRVDNGLVDKFYQDGIRVVGDGVAVVGMTVVDLASLVNRELAGDAHRDGLQVVPGVDDLFNQQYAGAEIIDLLVERCTFLSPWSKQQPIYFGDGLCRRPTIIDNRMFTGSDHEITIAALGGCISGNWANGRLAKVKLKGLRISGRTKDLPSIKILSFTDENDVYVPSRDIVHDSPSCVTDERGKIRAKDDAIYLENFCLKGYREAAQYVVSHVEGKPCGANAMCVDFHKVALQFGKRYLKVY